MVNKPESLKNISEFVRKPSASPEPSSYFNQDNYYLVKNATEHILAGDPNTTLRYDNSEYSLQFIAIHKGLWDARRPQVSLFFTTADGAMAHLCIPLELTQTPTDENIFLKFWLSMPADSKLPTGFSVNDLLYFRGTQSVKFATFDFCLQYNGERVTKPYMFSYFDTPLKFNTLTAPDWFRRDPTFTQADRVPTEAERQRAYRRKTFDQILNLRFRGTFSKFVLGTADPWVVSTESHFDDEKRQSVIIPTYYTVPTKSLAGSLFTKPSGAAGSCVRGLQNVKCYPIDIANQIDDEGNIIIDTTTQKPVDLTEIDPKRLDALDPKYSLDAKEKQLKSESWTRFIIAFTILFILVLSLLLAAVVYIFRGRQGGASIPPLAAQLSATNPV